ncbi:hypothetical protein, partial [Pseudoroseomonas sp. WGS1072]|uniref:hypothetical protein n=1 Tax=Roseomonas sp. WGS1072 TaxID=3366816 RepID=UPI003BF0BCA7
MTNAVSLACGVGWDDVADLNLAIRDDNPGHEPFDQLPFLLPVGVVKAVADTTAELFQAEAKARDVSLPFGLACQLLLLGGEGVLSLLEITAPALIFLKP